MAASNRRAGRGIPPAKLRSWVKIGAVLRAASVDARPSANPAPALECQHVPVQVVREPLAHLEVALARRPIAPRRRDLGDGTTRERCLHRQLEGELETCRALDRRRVEEAT